MALYRTSNPLDLKNSRISKLAFLDRFTREEYVSLDLASTGDTVEAAGIRLFMRRFENSKFIDLSREDTVAGVNQLETLGVLEAGRAVEILNTDDISVKEKYKG